MTIIVGSSGQTFELEDNYGNEDYHGQVDGDDLTIPIVIQKTLTENEEYMRFEDHDPATTDAKLIIFGDGGIVSAGQSFLEDLNCDDLEINNGIDLKQDAALVFIPVDAQNVPIPDREFRFGRNPNIGDFSHEGDGLFFRGKFTDLVAKEVIIEV